MTPPLSLALLGDGIGDRALLPVIEWTLRQHVHGLSLLEPGFHPRGGSPLSEAIQQVVEKYRPDILFVHRDAERVSHDVRRREIPTAPGRIVRVVPVRMTEAWLLIDLPAIRSAAGNPNGRQRLQLPPVSRLESLPDPKGVLHSLILDASGLSGSRRSRRLKRDIGLRVERVATLIRDFSPLRRLPAFVAFDEEVRRALDDLR